MLQERTTLFRERAQEIKLNLHHPRLQYPRHFLLKTHKVARKCVQRPPRRVIVPWRTFPGCITHQKRLEDPLSLSPTSKDVAPYTPGNADVGSRRGGTLSRPGQDPRPWETLRRSWRRDAGKAAQAGGEPRSDWRRGGVSLDRSRGRKDCHWGQRAATRA